MDHRNDGVQLGQNGEVDTGIAKRLQSIAFDGEFERSRVGREPEYGLKVAGFYEFIGFFSSLLKARIEFIGSVAL